VGEYYEEPNKATSGAAWLPEIERALAEAKRGGFDVLIVREVDRLSRDIYKLLTIENTLNSYGARVEYVLGNFDGAGGELLKLISSWQAKQEKEKITERVRRGIDSSVKSGNVVIGGARAPYGYDVGTANGKRTLLINEKEAAVVRNIYQWYLSGLTFGAIATKLTELGVVVPSKGKERTSSTRRGLKGWYSQVVRMIVTTETYAGVWHYNKNKIETIDGKRKKTARPKEDWLAVEVPAIVGRDVFSRAQEKREQNKRTEGKQHRHFYTLGGMILCGMCGTSANGQKKLERGKVYGYYRCSKPHKPKRHGHEPCPLPYFRQGFVEAVAWEFVKGLLLNPERLKTAFNQYVQQERVDNEPLLDLLKANEKRIESARGERQRLIEAYAAGVLSLDDIAQHKATLDAELKTLEGANGELAGEIAQRLPDVQLLDKLEGYAKVIRGRIGDIETNDNAKRELYKMLKLQVTLRIVEGEKQVRVACPFGELVGGEGGGVGGATGGQSMGSENMHQKVYMFSVANEKAAGDDLAAVLFSRVGIAVEG
jgi:site-specific DNA recombinase